MPEVPDEFPVSVIVDGTTFLGVYGVVEGTIELTSADFGEGVTIPDTEGALAAAERLLRNMAEDAIRRSEIPFLRDYQPGTGGD